MDKRAIGVFDSGLGGLTAVRELKKLLPHEDIVYLGDTGRVPYGNRGTETIIRYTMDDIRFMEQRQVKLIVAACATVSSTLPKEIAQSLSSPFVGVVEPAAIAAAKAAGSHIGIIGTSATVGSGSFVRALEALRSDLTIKAKACPLFVPLVENGLFDRDNPITSQVVELYLKDFQGVDTLILGCTHYPILKDAIAQYLPDTLLIDSGAETARWVQDYLTQNDLLNSSTGQGRAEYYVTDSVHGFAENARLFLGEEILDQVNFISVDQLKGRR